MRPTFSVFIATSLDGYIARKDGDIDWLHSFEDGADKEEDFGYAAFTADIDCMVMGRHTFEKVQSFGDWPYDGKQVIVLSKSLPHPPAGYENKIEVSVLAPEQLANHLYQRGVRKVYLDGGKLIQSFIRAGLLDDMIVTQLPMLLGTGIPLFGTHNNDIRLKLDWSKSYGNGFVQSRYIL